MDVLEKSNRGAPCQHATMPCQPIGSCITRLNCLFAPYPAPLQLPFAAQRCRAVVRRLLLGHPSPHSQPACAPASPPELCRHRQQRWRRRRRSADVGGAVVGADRPAPGGPRLVWLRLPGGVEPDPCGGESACWQRQAHACCTAASSWHGAALGVWWVWAVASCLQANC